MKKMQKNNEQVKELTKRLVQSLVGCKELVRCKNNAATTAGDVKSNHENYEKALRAKPKSTYYGSNGYQKSTEYCENCVTTMSTMYELSPEGKKLQRRMNGETDE